MATDNAATELQGRLLRNINEVSQIPSTALEVHTFDEAELVLPKTLPGLNNLQYCIWFTMQALWASLGRFYALLYIT